MSDLISISSNKGREVLVFLFGWKWFQDCCSGCLWPLQWHRRVCVPIFIPPSCCWYICQYNCSSVCSDLSVDCGSDGWVTVHWRPGLGFSQKVDLSRALLGTCPPSSLMSEDTLLFRVFMRDCGFIQQVLSRFRANSGQSLTWFSSTVLKVMEDRVTYSNMLIYARRPELPIITQLVKCVYDS